MPWPPELREYEERRAGNHQQKSAEAYLAGDREGHAKHHLEAAWRIAWLMGVTYEWPKAAVKPPEKIGFLQRLHRRILND